MLHRLRPHLKNPLKSRRSWFLILWAAVFIITGNILTASRGLPQDQLKNYTAAYAVVSPVAMQVVFTGVAVIMLVGACVKNDRWAYAAASALLSAWAFGYLWAWPGFHLGFPLRTAIIWLAISASVTIVAGGLRENGNELQR